MPRDYILKTPQPRDNAPAFVRRAMTWAKGTNELHGLIRGVLADGVVNQAEAAFVRKWLAQHSDTMHDRLVAAVAHRLDRVFEDGVVTDEELEELRGIFSEYTGKPDEGTPTPLPLCRPAPQLEIRGRCYCFTGTFAAGTRAWCHEQVKQRGGSHMERVQSGLDVLVIGSQISAGWVNQSYGRKIEGASSMRESWVSKFMVVKPVIVTEDHWLAEMARHDSLQPPRGLPADSTPTA